MKKIVEIKNLKKVYGKKGNLYTALSNISFEINEGEFVGIMGPSGAGKSTVLNILSTIDKPTSGEILINNVDITKMDENKVSNFRRDNLGFIFQDFNLLDSLTLRENIILPLAISKIKVKEINKRVDKVAKVLGITEILEKYPYNVSGGQNQRCAAARAMVTNPSLILADEPTGSLDSKSATDLLESLSELNKNNKATIMMVTHDAFSASYCDRILFIKDGEIFSQIMKNGTRKQFFKQILDLLAEISGGNMNDII